MNGADTAFVMVCSALALVMTPGLVIFYGGATHSKNVLSTMMRSYFLMGPASVIWLVYGYSPSFGPDVGGVIGDLSHFMGSGVAVTIAYCFIVTLAILYIIKAIMGLRVMEEQEDAGVDTSAHGEVSYNL
jgi:Amt family ammonium transporter